MVRDTPLSKWNKPCKNSCRECGSIRKEVCPIECRNLTQFSQRPNDRLEMACGPDHFVRPPIKICWWDLWSDPTIGTCIWDLWGPTICPKWRHDDSREVMICWLGRSGVITKPWMICWPDRLRRDKARPPRTIWFHNVGTRCSHDPCDQQGQQGSPPITMKKNGKFRGRSF